MSSRTESGEDELPQPEVVDRRRLRVSMVWLVPLVVALVAGSLAVRNLLNRGEDIIISFKTAEGLVAGKTEVRYKEVVIGKVQDIELTKDQSHVLVQVELNREAESFAVDDARYWVVRPRIGLGGVSGLGTLLSGTYIGADIGESKQHRTRFDGLEQPPTLLHGSKGTSYTLHAPDLGSLDIDSPVYFRRIQTGRVVGYTLDADGKGVTLQVFVDAPNDRFVTTDARFWNASGVDVKLGTDGLNVKTQSLATVLAGGVAFQPLGGDTGAEPAPADSEFKLYADSDTALTPPPGKPFEISMRFDQTLRGLEVGAPVEFRGIDFGRVTSVALAFDAATHSFPVDVVAKVYPNRLGAVGQLMMTDSMGEFFAPIVRKGLRAQARNGAILAGKLYIALDYVPNAKPVSFDASAVPLRIPTAAGRFDAIQEQLAEIVDKINRIPFEGLAGDLRQLLQRSDALLKTLDGELAPEMKATLAEARKTLDALSDTLGDDAPLLQNTQRTMQELQRAARSLGALSDYLNRHPEALLRGKPDDPDPHYQGQAPSGETP